MTNKRALECRLKDFLAINHTKSVLLSEENEYLSFQKIKRLTKAAFIIYGDFKCVIIPSTDNINFGGSTKKCQDHIAAGMAINQYVLMSDIVNHIKLTLVKLLLTNF